MRASLRFPFFGRGRTWRRGDRGLTARVAPAPAVRPALLSRCSGDLATGAARAYHARWLSNMRSPSAMDVVDRAKNMLRQPKKEWAKIDGEEVDPPALFTGYVARLALVPAAASLMSMLWSAQSGAGIGFGAALGSAIVQYFLSIAMVYVIAYIADLLAPGFEGHQSMDQALKLAAYAITPAWIGGVFVIVPAIGWLLTLLGGFYSLYVFFLGVPALMRVPPQKAVTYTVAVVAIAIGVNFILGLLNVKLLGMGGGAIGGMPF
jgi:hypothetical protein